MASPDKKAFLLRIDPALKTMFENDPDGHGLMQTFAAIVALAGAALPFALRAQVAPAPAEDRARGMMTSGRITPARI